MSFLIALLCGILSGFGIGGGTLLIIAITVFTGIPQLQAQGINLLYFLPTAGASLLGHIKNRLVDKSAFLWTVIPGVSATILSSLALSRFDANLSKRAFGLFLIFVGLSELFGKRKNGDST